MLDMESRLDGPGAFWKAIGVRSVGVAVVTTASAEGPVGFLALSVTHLCATPPTMMVSLDASTSAGEALIENGSFCINYLSKEQQALALRFFDKAAPKGAARFAEFAFHTLATGAPALDGVTGCLDCAVDEVITRHGTHIVLGRLIDAEQDYGRAPLISYAGKIE